MHNQRESLQRKLQESQKSMISLQTKYQEMEIKLKELNNLNQSYPTPTPKGPNIDDTLSTDDLLSFFNINSQLKPIDETVTSFVSEWNYNSQVFILNDNDEIKENDNLENNLKKYKKWKQEFGITLENILLEIKGMRENNTYQNESQQQFCALVLDLIQQKILLLKHLGKVHMTKNQQMSQIMFEAQKRINKLQCDLVKKNREMEIHLKVKQKMYDEIKNVQIQVQQLTKEYQVVVRELDHIRGRGESVDSSFS